MHSFTRWKFARRPNYVTNVDKKFPYSEVPYLGGYHLIKIPTDENLIELVDFWGEGLIQSEFGTSGFADAYNVNHEYQLVSNGPDRDKKIPNRIPVLSYSNCSTSAYIKDKTVKTVTLMAAPINKSCAADIARIVNIEKGKVVVLGFEEKSTDVQNLKEALTKVGLTFCHGYELPSALKGLTLFDSHRAYLNISEIKAEIEKSVKDGAIDRAMIISTTLDDEGNGDLIADIVKKLLKDGNSNVMQYAYKLMTNKENNVFENYLPTALKVLVKGGCCRIINKGTTNKLKAEENGDVVAVLHDTSYETWQIIPVINDNNIYVKLKNMERETFLTLIATAENDGERKLATATINDDEERFWWLLEPGQVDDDVLVLIKNKKYNQAVTHVKETDKHILTAKNGSLQDNVNEFGWFIAPCA